MSHSKKRVLIINQYGPEDTSPTSRYMADLSCALKENGWEVIPIASSQSYQRPGRAPRIQKELTALIEILFQGLVSRRCEQIICFSSPPCLLFIGAIISFFHRARLYHWCLDLHPDLALALSEISAGLLYQIPRFLMRLAYQYCDHLVTVDSDMRRIISHRYQKNSTCCAPWPLPESTPIANAHASSQKDSESDWFWIYSGNLGKGHEWKTLIDVQEELEKRSETGSLIIQGKGASVEAARAEGERRGLKKIQYCDYATPDRWQQQMQTARAVVVTQLPKICGMLWPSKLAPLMGFPVRLLWIGPTHGEIAKVIQKRGAAGTFTPGQTMEIANWLSNPPPIPQDLPDNRQTRESAINCWIQILKI